MPTVISILGVTFDFNITLDDHTTIFNLLVADALPQSNFNNEWHRRYTGSSKIAGFT